mmetsp:Transcript_45480/g.75909  ORF Transcript_45480/g.75909 Transcript_45480/m.75909 type:complete len:258 (-) Transcript_45480:1231-2004(-)
MSSLPLPAPSTAWASGVLEAESSTRSSLRTTPSLAVSWSVLTAIPPTLEVLAWSPSVSVVLMLSMSWLASLGNSRPLDTSVSSSLDSSTDGPLPRTSSSSSLASSLSLEEPTTSSSTLALVSTLSPAQEWAPSATWALRSEPPPPSSLSTTAWPVTSSPPAVLESPSMPTSTSTFSRLMRAPTTTMSSRSTSLSSSLMSTAPPLLTAPTPSPALLRPSAPTSGPPSSVLVSLEAAPTAVTRTCPVLPPLLVRVLTMV